MQPCTGSPQLQPPCTVAAPVLAAPRSAAPLLRLQQNAVCLPNAEQQQQQWCAVTGWGVVAGRGRDEADLAIQALKGNPTSCIQFVTALEITDNHHRYRYPLIPLVQEVTSGSQHANNELLHLVRQ